MVVGEASIHNIMGGMTSTGGVRLHNHKRKLKQRFDIIKKLGQGTYGKVQLGINKETGQEVAIKTIKKCKIETEADLIRIRREIQIMSSVQHPNIIHIYEVFENREKMVLVMEYAAGGELYDYLSERKVLTEQEARRIFRQIATAVFYCHKHKICHRDLKLENILLDQVGNAKIADFGLSNVFDEQRLLSTFCGSPLYASPEIVKGTPYHGPEVDCWSLGVLLYTLVYGAMPFDGSNFKRLVKQISQSDYFEPKKPSPASPLIKDMLTVPPGRRADIERICTHWWVNEGYEQNCLDIAEELAAQTPVRLDLLLSLVPQSASAEKLVVGDQRSPGDAVNSVSSETLVPTRCHSVGSLMELDRDDSDRRIRELLEEEPRSPPAGGEAKRKLETTPSMDETSAAGAKRKDRPKRREKRDERDTKTYKSASRHHSAPIPNSITEEAMEVEPTASSPPIVEIVDPNKPDTPAVANLELITECTERSPSKERSKTPANFEQEPPKLDGSKDYEQDDRREECQVKSPRDKGAVNAARKNGASNRVEAGGDRLESAAYVGQEPINLEETNREFKKLKEKALSLDSELASHEPREGVAKPFERRRSKIFETAEKFNQMASNVENEKPKKIFIPGVNVGGAKRVFERKASLSSITTPPPPKSSASKVIIDVPPTPISTTTTTAAATESKREDKLKTVEGIDVEENEEEKTKKKDEAKKRAVDIITGAIGKPPVQKRINGSPPVSPSSSQEPRKLPLKIPVGANDSRSATVSVSTPVETKFPFEEKPADANKRFTVTASSETPNAGQEEVPQAGESKVSSKMEITLKSATLPRPRKTSKAEISLSSVKSSDVPAAFRSEVEAKIDAFQPQRLRTQRSEVAFPVAAVVPQANRSSSLEPESRPKSVTPKERIIPIQVETDSHQPQQHSSTPPPSKPPPMPQRSLSQRSGSLSRQSTADSDTDSALGSTVGPEPIRKSPREYIIPIAVEGGGYVTPRSGSVEPESKTGTPTTASTPRSRFGRPRRMSSLLSDASEDESPFSSLHRDSEDLLQRHMHRLRSSRPSRQPSEHADSLSSGEDDDDDGFELLTAENLFSTLLSRVRSLTQRLNVDDNRTAGFPRSRLFDRLGSNSSQTFWGLNKPSSRRLSESQFRHSLSREGDIFSRKDPANSSNPGTPNSTGSHATSARDTVFDMGSSNTLPRDKVAREEADAEPTRARKEAHDSLEQSFTPSLARRLSRSLIEQTRRSLTRSPSASYDDRDAISPRDTPEATADRSISTTISDQTEYKDRSDASASRRAIRRANSLLEPSTVVADRCRDSPRRSISLFDDEIVARTSDSRGLARWFRESSVGRANANKLRKDSFRSYRADKIQEETPDDAGLDNGSVSECTSASVCDSNTNPFDATCSSLSAKSYETSPTESSSNIGDYKSPYKSDLSRNLFEDRLLAAENLIKESKLKNLGLPASGNERRSLTSIGGATGASTVSKRRSCIPSLRLRSGSLTREVGRMGDRRKSFADIQDVAGFAVRPLSPEKSLLSKLFKSAGNRDNESREKDEKEEKDGTTQKSKQRRISRFLRPDFFDTPREESRYVKEKEAQKAAENERRKSRFIRRKAESKTEVEENREDQDRKEDKELKNEANSSLRDGLSMEADQTSNDKMKSSGLDESSRNGFLHSLEKKLERLRSTDDTTKEVDKDAAKEASVKEKAAKDDATQLREHSAPPVQHDGPVVNESSTKNAVSVEDLSPVKKSSQSTPKSRVSSVLGLFKTSDSKQLTNGSTRSSTAILSKLKRSPTKNGKSADASTTEDSSVTGNGSKIPTKHLLGDTKAKKKPIATKRSDKSDKTTATSASSSSSSTSVSPKRSPAKEGPEKKQDGSRLTTLKQRSATGEKESKEKSLDRNGDDATAKLKKTGNRSSTIENGLASEATASEESSKKAKKLTKKPVAGSSESNDTEGDGTKKKRIVRVAKKVTKKSGEAAKVASDVGKTVPEEKEKSSITRSTKKKSTIGEKSSTGVVSKTGKTKEETKNGEQSTKVQTSERPNRNNLKLDLSKIPQHSFRNSTPKKDSPESGVNEPAAESLSKVGQRCGSIIGNRIPADKPLRTKDVVELKKEVTECARIIEGCAAGSAATAASTAKEKTAKDMENLSETMTRATAAAASSIANQRASCISRDSSNDYANELLSPMDEPESFDSWSVSSAEYGHARPDLRSPTSPSHSLLGKGDNAESVIDRIRRRSFYSRFNDRRRPSLTAPPPGITAPSSVTLPRKFSGVASQHRDHRDRGKYSGGYGLSTNPTGSRRAIDRSYSLYGDDSVGLTRNRSLDRSRYSDAEHHLPSLSSSYDPLRRYLRSPTFDLSTSRSRYHSADFTAEPDLASCYASLDPHTSTSSSAFHSSLPRKYGSGLIEPKTVEYYEELLAPNCSDYLQSRKSPACSDYLNRCENGYYNGNLDLYSNGTRRKPSFGESPTALEQCDRRSVASGGDCDGELAEQKRNIGDRTMDGTRPSTSTSAEAPSNDCG